MTLPSPSRTRHRARKGEGDALRLEILDAAEQLFIEAGTTEAVTIRAIADRVGVTPPSIYLHFRDKEDLIYQVCLRNLEKLTSKMMAVLGEGTVMERLARIGTAYMEFGLENPGSYRVLFLDEPPENLDYENDPGVGAYALLTSLLEEGKANGELRSDLDVEQASFFLWASVHGATLLLLDKQALSEHLPLPRAEEAVAAVIDLALGAIGHRS